MKIVKLWLLSYLVFAAFVASAQNNMQSNRANEPVAMDSRIKTYIYSENEVFKLVVHYGYQTSIEFQDGEDIQTISVGNNYAWQISPIGGRIFIKPLEENIKTNMTILTNKRAYHFDIESKLMSYSVDEELVYVVRFFFPSENFDLAKPMMNAGNFTMPVNEVQSFNFDYTISGPEKYAPTKIFDDGTNTFFKLPLGVGLPKFESSADDGGEVLMPRQKGEYIIVDKISPSFKLTYGDAVIYVFNEKVMGGR